MWDAAKAANLAPANKPGVYNAIAALRDMGAELHSAAHEAQSNAGEDDDGPFPSMAFEPLTEWFSPSDQQER